MNALYRINAFNIPVYQQSIVILSFAQTCMSPKSQSVEMHIIIYYTIYFSEVKH